MKIALVVENMDPQGGGREKSVAQMAACLTERGQDVTVICQTSSWPDSPVEVRVLGRRGIGRAARLAGFVADVQKVIGRGEFDIVHATLPVPGADVYQPRGGTIPAQLAAGARRWGRLGCLRSLAAEPLNPARRRLGRFEREIMADDKTLCLAVSKMVAGEFHQYYGRDTGVEVVYNGADLPDFKPDDWADWRQRRRFELGVGRNDPVFLCVAKNFVLKAVRETIVAFAKWHEAGGALTNPRLVIVGREEPEGYQRIAGLLNVGRRVVFVPPTQEIVRWYAAADACVLLSWYDPCSRAILEATRLGIPSITTAYNGASEILSAGAGIVVGSPRDKSAIIAAIDELASSDRRAPRVRACRALADGISVGAHVDRLLETYRQVEAGR